MIDNQADGKWVSADEAVKQYAVSKEHWYVLASRKKFRKQKFNDGVKRYFVPNDYELVPNIRVITTNNSTERQETKEEGLVKQLEEMREQLRKVETTRLEEQVAILKEDKQYLREKLDDVHSQLPQVLEKLGRLQADNLSYKSEIDTLTAEKEKFEAWYKAQDKMGDILRQELDEYKNVTLSLYKKFIEPNTKE